MGMLWEREKIKNIDERVSALKEQIKEIKNDELKKYVNIDKKFDKHDILDTQDVFGLTKNQPLLGLETFTKGMLFVKNQKPDETLTKFLRYIELGTKDTSDCWKLDSNFYFKLLDKYFSDDMKFSYSPKTTDLIFDKQITDFMIRTKGFCFATNFDINQKNYLDNINRKSSNHDITECLFTSPYLPEELKLNFKNSELKKSTEPFKSKMKTIQQGFELNPLQFSSFLGICMAKVMTKDKKVFDTFLKENLLMDARNELGNINNHIFDYAFGAELKNQILSFKTLSLDEEEISRFSEICKNYELLATNKFIEQSITNSRLYLRNDRTIADDWEALKRKEKVLFFPDGKTKVIDNNLECHFFSTSWGEDKNMTDHVKDLALLSTKGDWLGNPCFLDKAAIDTFIHNNYGSSHYIETLYASTILAFPTVLRNNFMPCHFVNKDNIIDLYLEGGGELEKINEIEDYLKYNINGR